MRAAPFQSPNYTTLVICFGCNLFGSEPNTLQIYSALFGPIIPYPPYPRTRMVTTSKGSTFQNLSYAPIDSARRELSNAYMKSLFPHKPSQSVFSVAETPPHSAIAEQERQTSFCCKVRCLPSQSPSLFAFVGHFA